MGRWKLIGLIVLVLIVLVVFVTLLLLAHDPGPPIFCESSDPAHIGLKAIRIQGEILTPYTPSPSGVSGSDLELEIRVDNLTGGSISNLNCIGSEAFAETVPGCPTYLEYGETMNLKPNAASPGIYGQKYYEPSGVIVIEYLDYGELKKTATITCSGPITVS